MRKNNLKIKLRASARYLVEASPLGPFFFWRYQNGPFNSACKIGRREGWRKAVDWILESPTKGLLVDKKAHSALENKLTFLTEVELLLTEFRKTLTLERIEKLDNSDVQRFCCALIRHLINNEYVFYVSPEEYDKLANISLDFELLATGEASEIRNLLVRLMYKPPSEVLDDKIALDSFARLPPFLEALIVDALSDFREEQRIKENVTIIARPQRDTARKVAKQYEENPYPRWISISLPEPESRLNYLRQFFSENELSFSDQPFDVLVPGCGTGQRAIQWAVGYGKNARVLAIDLSRSSLAYGIRKARELGVQNIDFAQADFNELDTTRKFHIVECTGVVHHTENPLQSWKSLVDLTLPGGLIHVSLYSELSRRSIVKVRNEAGIDANYLAENRVDSDYIRAKRYEMLIKTPEMVLNELPLREDFFDLSRCRDLLFNEVEHRFTIPQISAMIEELGLEFRGFEDPQLLRDKFWSCYPKGKDRLNLEKWWEFEKKHPMIFRELYEIWSLRV